MFSNYRWTKHSSPEAWSCEYRQPAVRKKTTKLAAWFHLYAWTGWSLVSSTRARPSIGRASKIKNDSLALPCNKVVFSSIDTIFTPIFWWLWSTDRCFLTYAWSTSSRVCSTNVDAFHFFLMTRKILKTLYPSQMRLIISVPKQNFFILLPRLFHIPCERREAWHCIKQGARNDLQKVLI